MGLGSSQIWWGRCYGGARATGGVSLSWRVVADVDVCVYGGYRGFSMTLCFVAGGLVMCMGTGFVA